MPQVSSCLPCASRTLERATSVSAPVAPDATHESDIVHTAAYEPVRPPLLHGRRRLLEVLDPLQESPEASLYGPVPVTPQIVPAHSLLHAARRATRNTAPLLKLREPAVVPDIGTPAHSILRR